MEYIKIGKIVTTHGIKGEIRILSDFKFKNKVFNVGNKIYIGKEKKEMVINSYRVHKNYDMITLNNYNNINDVLKYIKEFVYIKKGDYNFDGYLDEDLIGFNVLMNDKKIGNIKNIIKIPNNSLFEVIDNEKMFYIPNNKDLIINIDFKNKNISIKYIEGLI